MKRIKQIFAAFALVACACCGLFGAQALGIDALSTFYIDQVYANAPELDIFLYALDGDGNSLSPALASAAGVELTLGEGNKLPTGVIGMASEPICYIFVVDNSMNVEQEAFDHYITAMLQILRGMNENDQMMLYTTAGGVTQLDDAGGTRREESALLSKLKRVDAEPDLVGAITQVAADVNNDFTATAPRKAVFVCTSMLSMVEDSTALGALMSNEAMSKLNMALFGFAASDGLANLPLLATATNGKLNLCKAEEIEELMLQKQSYLANALEIKTTLTDAQSGEKIDTLTISVPALGSAVKASTDVYMGHKLAKPELQAVRILDRTHLELTFNQAVANAGTPGAYALRSEDIWGWQVGVRAVELAEDGRSAILTTDPLYSGSYAASLRAVTSRMTAANVTGGTKLLFAAEGWPRDRDFYLARFRLPAVLLLAFLAVLLMMSALQHPRDPQTETAAEAEHLLAHADSAAPLLPKRMVTLYARTRGAVAESRTALVVKGSLMIGSDPAQCDYCVEDTMIAPQHCVLSIEGEDVFVQPIGNAAVRCGKSRIADAHRLSGGDSFTIGRTTIRLAV